ncbi:MAG: UDP-N-acetylglucosamine pyrophosphorylase [Clostridia bacterium]|nr:UDP-N-acetylglucosamine pyrophosphorylase [Clostridia bacterium]
MNDEIKTKALLDLSHSMAGRYLKKYEYPYLAIPDIKEMILDIQSKLSDEFIRIKEGVFVHKTAVVAPTAYIGAPTVICAGTEVRHCAFIRGSALIGENCVIGNSTEVKNAVIFDNVQVPHFNYVGDSILGYKSHMGAGSVTSNVKSDKTNVVLKIGDERIETGMRKFGAVLGDHVEVGCNSTLNPGTIIGRHTNVYPNSCVRGIIPAEHIYKNKENIVMKIKGDND